MAVMPELGPEIGVGRPSKNGEGAHNVSRADAATDAGMTEHQTTTAVRVANVPKDDGYPRRNQDKRNAVLRLQQDEAWGRIARDPAHLSDVPLLV